jgi:small subunit ribosomal protein S3
LGQKVHPVGLRLGIIRSWDSKWFAKRQYAKLVHEDAKIRDFLKSKLFHAGVSRIEIARAADRARIRIHTARPGIVIGKKGAEIEALKRQLEQMVKREILIDIQEVRKPEMDATLVAENIALQLTRRVAFRRAMKKAVSSALKFGAKGVRVACAGRLGGAEMARREWYREADIDYGTAVAKTTYGVIGVKVWIFKGEVLT